jgi:hypothetical protein
MVLLAPWNPQNWHETFTQEGTLMFARTDTGSY